MDIAIAFLLWLSDSRTFVWPGSNPCMHCITQAEFGRLVCDFEETMTFKVWQACPQVGGSMVTYIQVLIHLNCWTSHDTVSACRHQGDAACIVGCEGPHEVNWLALLRLLACTRVHTIHSWVLVSRLEVPPAGCIWVAVSTTSFSTLQMGLNIRELLPSLHSSYIDNHFTATNITGNE
jgi:hypothetical protein